MSDEDDEMPTNPFALPQTERNQGRRPLCPWQEPEHADYYVPVDHTETAFTDFKDHIRQPADLINEGRLVVVYGESGCGKTSLIHRCVHHLKTNLEASNKAAIIVDLSRHPMADATIEQRMEMVCQSVTSRLRRELKELNGVTLDMTKSYAVYDEVSNALAGKSAVVVVLLPPLEDVITLRPSNNGHRPPAPRSTIDELSEYLKLTRPGIVFFAESAQVTEIDDWLGMLRNAGRDFAIALSVGPLTEEDHGWLFAQNRLDRLANRDGSPELREETVRTLLQNSGPMAVAELQTLLSGVWDFAIQRDPPLKTVRYEDIGIYYYEESRKHRRSRPS